MEFNPRTARERKEFMKTGKFIFQLLILIALAVAFWAFVACKIMEGLGWKPF